MLVREVDADGRSLAVRELGAPDDIPIVFWHGLGPGHSGATFAVAAEPLARAGYRVLAIDAPGFGRSPRVSDEEYALDELARLVWAVADALAIERVVVAGHSWGGSVAVFSAAARPDRTAALVLYDSGTSDFADHPLADLDATLEQLIDSQRELSGAESWDRLVELLRAEKLDQPWTLDAWRDATTIGPDGTVAVRASAEARGAAAYQAMRGRPSGRWSELAAGRVPTLVVLATEPPDARAANERLLSRFLDAVPQTEVLRPGCRHQVFADLGARAGDLTVTWLDGLDLR